MVRPKIVVSHKAPASRICLRDNGTNTTNTTSSATFIFGCPSQGDKPRLITFGHQIIRSKKKAVERLQYSRWRNRDYIEMLKVNVAVAQSNRNVSYFQSFAPVYALRRLIQTVFCCRRVPTTATNNHLFFLVFLRSAASNSCEKALVRDAGFRNQCRSAQMSTPCPSSTLQHLC